MATPALFSVKVLPSNEYYVKVIYAFGKYKGETLGINLSFGLVEWKTINGLLAHKKLPFAANKKAISGVMNALEVYGKETLGMDISA